MGLSFEKKNMAQLSTVMNRTKKSRISGIWAASLLRFAASRRLATKRVSLASRKWNEMKIKRTERAVVAANPLKFLNVELVSDMPPTC